MVRVPRLSSLRRNWLRLEGPGSRLLRWTRLQALVVLLLCLSVAAASSLPWLIKPELQPGSLAPFDAIAPKDVLVQDSTALEQQRASLVARSVVQVIDQDQNQRLKQRLEQQLLQLQEVTNTGSGARIGPVNLSEPEQKWLEQRSEQEHLAWDAAVRSTANRMLSQGLVSNLAVEQLRQAADLQLKAVALKEPASRSLATKVLTSALRGSSNLRTDPNLSKQLIEEQLTKQAIPTIQVRKGDLITRKGEPISPQAYDVLDYFGRVRREPQPLIWFKRFVEAAAGCAAMLLVMRRERPGLEVRHALLAVGLLLLVQVAKLWFKGTVSPLAVLVPPTLVLAEGLGTGCGLIWMGVAALLWPEPVLGLGDGRLLVAATVAAAGALIAGRQRSRGQLLQLTVLLPIGALVGQWLLLQLQPFTGLRLWGSLNPSLDELATDALLLGVLLMFSLLLIPMLEGSFGLLTRARLLELADQERPLLRRLSCEAPGTFEHTLMICGLAEEGARAIGADVDLIRTGSLYHDVGKLHAPDWFIENQKDGPNPHDALDDPQASAAVLQAHVDEGLKLARRHRLPRPIADFIPEHQGTLKMGYFLHKAQERGGAVEERRFRYRGPEPRSKETAILMLADGCEAALRSLPPDTSDAQAVDTVRRIVEARQRDGQLRKSSLNRSEVELVIRAFVQVWRRMRHRRIPYPIPARR
ncbi:HDIG domain-containing protein [Synechococcus sp. HB1133]|uniref:HDIG domain-containing metalloprotein n=1 Tax=unclassified Synechococcus TaxID=2626047 RepID=UPI00140DA101|nr:MULTISPECIES: HDIG domain-containing metalloprotein [unclassified Synechococcus]MCB4394555.1 HDIG domain-containing protein [Synechococcus sp. PH41509]MCB4422715.1 HDIG domain-containing protein [Synechococcus sp. HB1133]MCB4430321.1 HDIG domain-containing protein [Synechococcus sp. HBA1120]NHI81663.1 HDIG domain-containing protein [Synechococcus sp. HB1133]